MKRITGLNLHRNVNVGDGHCSPLQYFEFPGEAEQHDIRDSAPARTDVTIYGGGTLVRWIGGQAGRLPCGMRVGWGIGYTERHRLRRHAATAHRQAATHLHLFGNRDWGIDVGEYVPCVSCMSPLFDQSYAVEHDVVFYGHAKLAPLEGCSPRMLNTEPDLATVVRFLGSGHTVVTSSYHGMYWATLLGRRVIVLPYGSKFFHFRYPVPLVSQWRDGVAKARPFPDALEQCRARNRAFYERVMESWPARL